MRVPRVRFTVRGMMLALVAVSAGLASLVSASEALAGSVLLLTLATFAVAILGVVYRRGDARASWLGFALLGWGYMFVASGSWWDRTVDRPELVTSAALTHLYLQFPHERNPMPLPSTITHLFNAPDPRNEAVWTKLAQPLSMNFDEVRLEELLKYVKSATQGSTDAGIPIYVDPAGLRAAHQTMKLPVSISVENVPLRTTLTLVLRQLGLTFDVRDGLLTITKGSADPLGLDAFLRIGHCYLALLAAWIGGFAGRYFSRTCDGPIQQR